MLFVLEPVYATKFTKDTWLTIPDTRNNREMNSRKNMNQGFYTHINLALSVKAVDELTIREVYNPGTTTTSTF